MKTHKTVNARKGKVNRPLADRIAGREVWVDRKTGREVSKPAESERSERMPNGEFRYLPRINGPHDSAKWALHASGRNTTAKLRREKAILANFAPGHAERILLGMHVGPTTGPVKIGGAL